MPRLSIAAAAFHYDADDPEGFRAGMHRLGKLLGAKATGITVYELPPGEAICPYHYEYGEEEWLVVLEGEPPLRLPQGTRRLRPWDACAFSVGPGGAHRGWKGTDALVRVLLFFVVRGPAAAGSSHSQ